MQFLVTGRDATDSDALERRMAARDAHIATLDELFAAGHMLFGVAILDGEGAMCGSSMVVDFDTQAELEQEWLAREPYVTGNVWETVTVEECRVGPSFTSLLPR